MLNLIPLNVFFSFYHICFFKYIFCVFLSFRLFVCFGTTNLKANNLCFKYYYSANPCKNTFFF